MDSEENIASIIYSRDFIRSSYVIYGESDGSWKEDPRYFQRVLVSPLALMKMTLHASYGGNIEIMGLLVGQTVNDVFVVTDSFSLPVEGTETRVNAQAEACEYMIAFKDALYQSSRPSAVIGWYHSHPGYGCWLSGIDVTTQMTNQKFQDPFVAVVIDPQHTISNGVTSIGAFRTFPEGKKYRNQQASTYQAVPIDKIQDFGAHSAAYYQLQVECFNNEINQEVINLVHVKYWPAILSCSEPNIDSSTSKTQEITNKIHHFSDVSSKVQQAATSVSGLDVEMLGQLEKDSFDVAAISFNGTLTDFVKEALFL